MDPIGTVPALDLLTQDQLDQLFDSQTGYMSKVNETFDILDAMDEAADASAAAAAAGVKGDGTNNNNSNDKNSANNNNNSNNENEKNSEQNANDSNENDKIGNGVNEEPKMRRKHSRSASLITDKKTLILDVDNTLIYVRHFMDEMRVSDSVRLGEKRARVKKLTYRLDLEFTEAGQMSVYDHIITSADEHIPQRSDWFPDEITKVALIHQADPTGCEIELLDEYEENEESSEAKNDDNSTNNNESSSQDKSGNKDSDSKGDNSDEKRLKTIEISFLKNSKELSQLEPMMNRRDHVEVDFMYGGYLVRIRPNLAKFLANCCTMFDVILFTAADGSVYKGLLHQVHELLKQKLDEIKDELHVPVPEKLWSAVYFRDDCDEKFDEHGLPYRHKNLSKLGRDLSTIVMVDDNPLSYRGYEPNAMRVAGFWGQAYPEDNELTSTLLPTLITVSKHKDVRYHLSGLEAPSDNESEQGKLDAEDSARDTDEEIEHQRKHSREQSSKFLDTLKKALDEDDETGAASNDDDEDSLEDSQSSGKDLEQAENEHLNDGTNMETVNDLLPGSQQSKDAILSDQELAKMSTYSRGHSDSVRIRNDVNDLHDATRAEDAIDPNLTQIDENVENEKQNEKTSNNSNNNNILDLFEAGRNSKRSSLASSMGGGGVVFYNVDDESGRPLKPVSMNNNEESRYSDAIGATILQPNESIGDFLQFEPVSGQSEKTPSAATLTTESNDLKSIGTNGTESNSNSNSNSNTNSNSNSNSNEENKRRNSVEMDRKQRIQKNGHESIWDESRSDSGTRNSDEKNRLNAKSAGESKKHISSDSAALNEKYGFVSVNERIESRSKNEEASNENDNENDDDDDENENENENENGNDNENDNENRNEPDYVSSGALNVLGTRSSADVDFDDGQYPLTDDEDRAKPSGCLCFGLFSKKKSKTKYTKSRGPMSQQDSIR